MIFNRSVNSVSLSPDTEPKIAFATRWMREVDCRCAEPFGSRRVKILLQPNMVGVGDFTETLPLAVAALDPAEVAKPEANPPVNASQTPGIARPFIPGRPCQGNIGRCRPQHPTDPADAFVPGGDFYDGRDAIDLCLVT